MSSYSRILFVLLLIGAVTGCGDVRTKVSGKISYPDGSPLTVGEIRGFGGTDKDGAHVRAFIKEDGSYELYDVKPGDKVRAGLTYKLAIVNATVEEAVGGSGGSAPRITGPSGLAAPSPMALPKRIQHVATKYSDMATSGIIMEVPKSSKPFVFNFEVTKP